MDFPKDTCLSCDEWISWRNQLAQNYRRLARVILALAFRWRAEREQHQTDNTGEDYGANSAKVDLHDCSII